MNRQRISILLFVLMFAGLFWSRALLSITQGAWLVLAIFSFIADRYNPLKDPAFAWSCVPLLLCLLGCWQQPFATANYDYLLTLSAYPVTILAVTATTETTIKKYWLPTWACATFIGLCYPFTWYALHTASANKAYGAGQSLPTFMDTDHVRFGIFLCSSFLLALVYRKGRSKMYLAATTVLCLAIFFLAVRTAWVILLIMGMYFLVTDYLFRQSKKWLALLKLVSFFVVVITAVYFLFPTVRQKIAYSIYDWQQYRPQTYDPLYSDAARRAVNHVAWHAIQTQTGANAGWAGIPGALQRSFSVLFPGAVLNYGWPFNQFLFWWMGSGWWGMCLFTAWLLYPLLWGWKHRNNGLIAWTIAIAVSCLAECTLSLQYGLWLHIWPLAIVWKSRERSLQQTVIPEIE